MGSLKPCPFCGGKAELHIETITDDNGDAIEARYWVECMWCHTKSGRSSAKDKALANWNRRVK